MRHGKLILALIALAASLLIWYLGSPTLQGEMKTMAPDVDKKLASRSMYIAPAELVGLLYNASFGVRILDLRPEPEFNLFHILDAKRVSLGQIKDPDWVRSLPADTALILVGNGEEAATQAYRILAAFKVPNVYILEGGVNHWVEVFGPDRVAPAARGCTGAECRRYAFDAALGDRQPESDPGIERIAGWKYQKKVTPIGHTAKKSGGCG